jgi:hypothetical protein
MTKWENELILGDFGLAVQLKDPTEKRRYWSLIINSQFCSILF